MHFGVNYTPSDNWFHAWLNPNWESIKQDFKDIASIGMDHVRIFPLWPHLQPNRTWINRDGICDVRKMVRLAGESGLDVYVDIFQGHLSSFDFLPSWLVSWHRRNMFTDPEVVAAEAELIKVLVLELLQEPAFTGITLGNEVNQFSAAPHPAPMTLTAAESERWLDTLLDTARAEKAPHVFYSVNDAVWFTRNHPFTPVQSATKGDFTTVHAWVFNGIAERYGSHSSELDTYALYLAELAHAFSSDLSRPVWVQEIGAPQNVLTPEQCPEFCVNSIKHLADSSHIWGVTWWCSHDVPSKFGDFPFFEHSLGLFDEHGNLKPIGEAYAESAAKYRSSPAPAPRTNAVVIPTKLDGNPADPATLAPGGSVCEQWMSAQSAGRRPTLLTDVVAADEARCAALSITNFEPEITPVPSQFYNAVSDPAFNQI